MGTKRKTVLVVDDDEGMRDTLTAILKKSYRVLNAATGEEGLAILKREDVNLMLLDVKLPGIGGLEVLSIVRENYSLVEVIVVSALSEVEVAVSTMKQGAYHYITKEFDYDGLRSLVRNALERQDLSRQLITLNAQVEEQRESEFVLGPSKAMREIVDLAQKVAKLPATVLIQGESGNRQGVTREAPAPRVRKQRRPVYRGQPRRGAAGPGREHVVRPRARGIHGCAPAITRQVRAGGWRHPVSRRDRGPGAGPPGQAAAGDPGGRDRASRRNQADQDRFQAGRGDQRRPGPSGQRGQVSR